MDQQKIWKEIGDYWININSKVSSPLGIKYMFHDPESDKKQRKWCNSDTIQNFLILTHLRVVLGKFMQSYIEGIAVKFHDCSTKKIKFEMNNGVNMIL